jgi:hypothetical protein
MKTIELSKMNPGLDWDEVVNFLLDNGYDMIKNDILGPPHVEYEYSDMYEYWDGLKNLINGRHTISDNGTGE